MYLCKQDSGMSIPVLACNAAIELDNFLLNRNKQFDAVPLLIKALQIQGGDNGQSSLRNPGNALIINRAISNAGMINSPLRTAEQLVKHTDEIQSRLNSIISEEKDNTTSEEIKKLRLFCLELSKSASNYASSVNEMEPMHPFRR